ncbi:TPA: hypothetical protein ACGIK9_003375 [Acinetobacter baumannii]|uniref:hypothetical protein n=1 Tax=Acinetobacter baumannii TaxID=470 RepID=UPI00338F7F82
MIRTCTRSAKDTKDFYNTNPKDVGITVIGGLTGLGTMTQAELGKKVEAVKQVLRNK